MARWRHFFEWHAATSGLGAADRFAALSGLAHDPLLRDVLGAFWMGAAVCRAGSRRGWKRRAISEHWLPEQRVSVAHVTPGVATLSPKSRRAGSSGRCPLAARLLRR